jgi:hypothetical protein
MTGPAMLEGNPAAASTQPFGFYLAQAMSM